MDTLLTGLRSDLIAQDLKSFESSIDVTNLEKEIDVTQNDLQKVEKKVDNLEQGIRGIANTVTMEYIGDINNTYAEWVDNLDDKVDNVDTRIQDVDTQVDDINTNLSYVNDEIQDLNQFIQDESENLANFGTVKDAYTEIKGILQTNHLKLQDNTFLTASKNGTAYFLKNDRKTSAPLVVSDALFRGNTRAIGTYATNANFNDSRGGWRSQTPLLTRTSSNLPWGASFGGQNYYSHFPASDQNTYIRPGASNKSIVMDNARVISHKAVRNDFCKSGTGGLCSHLPYENNTTYIRPGVDGADIIIDKAGRIITSAKRELNLYGGSNIRMYAPSISAKSSQTALCSGVTGGQCSYFPHNTTQNVYIRPGQNDKHVIIDRNKGLLMVSNTIHHQAQQNNLCGSNLCSHISHANGSSYIRPGTRGRQVYLGDAYTSSVIIGDPNTTSSYTHIRTPRTFIGRHLDATSNWGKNNDKTLFAGWGSAKVVLGNNANKGEIFAFNAPTNSVNVTNNLNVHANLGIGTVTPRYKLDVIGSGYISSNLAVENMLGAKIIGAGNLVAKENIGINNGFTRSVIRSDGSQTLYRGINQYSIHMNASNGSIHSIGTITASNINAISGVCAGGICLTPQDIAKLKRFASTLSNL